MDNTSAHPLAPDWPGANAGRVLLTPDQAAHALGIGRWKLYELLRRGSLASVRIGSCRRIPVRAVEEFVAELLRAEVGPSA